MPIDPPHDQDFGHDGSDLSIDLSNPDALEIFLNDKVVTDHFGTHDELYNVATSPAPHMDLRTYSGRAAPIGLTRDELRDGAAELVELYGGSRNAIQWLDLSPVADDIVEHDMPIDDMILNSRSCSPTSRSIPQTMSCTQPLSPIMKTSASFFQPQPEIRILSPAVTLSTRKSRQPVPKTSPTKRAGKTSRRQTPRRRTRVTTQRSPSPVKTPEIMDVHEIKAPLREPWEAHHLTDTDSLYEMIEETFPYAALALDQKSFDEYDVMHDIRKGLMKTKAERTALTAVRRKICGRERSRRNRARERELRSVNRARWRKARITLRLLAAVRMMKGKPL